MNESTEGQAILEAGEIQEYLRGGKKKRIEKKVPLSCSRFYEEGETTHMHVHTQTAQQYLT